MSLNTCLFYACILLQRSLPGPSPGDLGDGTDVKVWGIPRTRGRKREGILALRTCGRGVTSLEQWPCPAGKGGPGRGGGSGGPPYRALPRQRRVPGLVVTRPDPSAGSPSYESGSITQHPVF